MNRLTIGVFVSLVFIMIVTVLNIKPEMNSVNNCKSGVVCSKKDCCNKVVKACSPNCSKPCCTQNIVKTCGSNCSKPCCSKKLNKKCATNCTKPCCETT